jgi:excisionase family DNA binding protein
MPNAPRREKADKAKYEGKEYLDYEEAADYLGVKRATLYNYVNDLDIQTHKFKRDRRRYIAIGDVKRIEAVMEKPWLAGPDESATTHAA